MNDEIVGVTIGVIVFSLIIAIVVGVAFGICTIVSIAPVKIFNAEYDTNYTAWQWATSENTIKEYIGKGNVSRINLNVGGELK